MRRWANSASLALAVALILPTGAAKQKTSTRTAPLFEFHSNFWVNLHQTLFHEALLSESLLSAGKPDRRLQSDTPLAASGMSDAEKKAWDAAVTFYANTFAERRELFDDDMVRVNKQLTSLPDNSTNSTAAGLPPALAAVLQSAAPVYAKYWWPAHDKSNKDWIASQTANVKALGPTVAAAMEKDLHQAWPAAPLRVDVCYYVPEIGHAYTTDDPPHTTFSSSGVQLEGLSGFETLFHEASHSFADTMSNTLFSECGAEKKNCGDLWHAILFYTAGVEVRRALPPADQANFTAYAYKYGLYGRGDYPKYRRVLESDWQKYLDGQMDFTAAIRAMAADLR